MHRIALALALLGVPAAAQAACPAVQVASASLGTQRVPRMGAGSDLLTQSATFHNTTGSPVRFTIALVNRAFQQNFVAGQAFTLPAGGRAEVVLGNVLRPGLDLAGLRAGVSLACP